MSLEKSALQKALLASWEKPTWLTLFLWPLSLIYRFVFALRKYLYEFGILSTYTAPVPVIVVGNLSVGGTGKTPLVIHLVELLREMGLKPGVISRGYSGEATVYPLLMRDETSVVDSGDEPALIYRRTAVPMVVGPDRKADIELLLASADIDIVISDDGLQHLALNRDLEICLLDDTSPLNNRCLLPAGPMREPLSRLRSIDLIVRHQSSAPDKLVRGDISEFSQKDSVMFLEPSQPQPLVADSRGQFDTAAPCHAIAGIGNPQRFFNTCSELGLIFEPHSFVDHHKFRESDIEFADGYSVLMTEKDAVKCQAFAKPNHWYLPVDAKLSSGFGKMFAEKINSHIK